MNAELVEIARIFEQTYDPQEIIRKAAEEKVRHLESTIGNNSNGNERFLSKLIYLLKELGAVGFGGTGQEEYQQKQAAAQVRLAISIYFKNILRRRWNVFKNDADYDEVQAGNLPGANMDLVNPNQNGICEAEKAYIKQEIFHVMLNNYNDKPVLAQLVSCLGTIVREAEFPQSWPEYLVTCRQLLITGSGDMSVERSESAIKNELTNMYIGLLGVYQVLQMYRYKDKQDEMAKRIVDEICTELIPIIGEIVRQQLDCLYVHGGDGSASVSENINTNANSSLEMLQSLEPKRQQVVKMALKVFYSSVCNELPTILMETRDELVRWGNLLIRIILTHTKNNGGLQDRDAVENYDYSSSYYERGGEIETENRSLKWAQRSINKIYNRYGNPGVLMQGLGVSKRHKRKYWEFAKLFSQEFAPRILMVYLKGLEAHYASTKGFEGVGMDGCLMAARSRSIIYRYIRDCVEDKQMWKLIQDELGVIIDRLILKELEHSYYKYELGGQDENEDKQAEVERVINSILDPSYTFTNSSSSSTVYYEHEESRNPTLAAMAVLETICVERQKSSMEFLVNYVVERIATSYQNSHEGSAGERYAALAILSTISDGIKAMVRGNGDCKSRGAEEKNNSKVIEVITHQIEHVVIPEVFSEFNLDNGGYNRKEMRGGMNILRIKALEIVTRYSGLLVEYMANPQGLVLQLLEQITGNRRERMEVRILSALAVNELITKIDKANKKARNESAEGIETIVVHIIRYLMEMLEETVKLVNAGSTDANAEVIVSTNMNTNTNNVEVLLIELIQELVETYSGRIGREYILQLVQGLATKVDLLVNSLSLRLSKLAQQQHRNLGAAGGVIDGNDDDSDGDEDEEKKEQAVEMIKTVFGTIQILLEPLENHPEPILLGNSENNKSGSVDDNSKRPNGNNGESGVDCIQHIKGIVYPVISKIIELEIYECYQIAISVFDNLVFMTSSPLSAINGVVSGNYENKAQVEEFEVHLFRLVLNKVVGLFDPGNENISWETADQTMEILFESMVLVNTKLLNLHHRVKISGQLNVQGDQTLGYGENFVRDSNSGLGLDLDSITMRINMDLYYNEDGAVFQFMIRIIDLLFSQGGNGGEWRKVISNYFGSSGMDDDDSEGEGDNEMVDTICEIVQNIILLYSISTKLFNMDNVGIGGEKYVDRQVVEKYIRLILPLLFSSAAHPNTDTITNISGTKNRSAGVKNQSMFLTVLSILTFNTYPYQVANVGLNVHQSMSFLLGLASHSGYQAVIERSIQKYAGRNRMRRIIDLKLTIVALLDYIQLCLSTVNSGGELKMVKMVKYVIDCFGRLPRAILQYNSLVRSSSQPGGGKTNNNRYGGDADEEIEDVVNLMEVHQEEGDQDDMDDYDEFGVEYDEEGGDGMDEEYSEVDENDIDVQEEQHEQQIVDSKHILFDFDVYSYFKSFYYKCYYPKISCLNREVLEQMESILNSDQRQLLLDLISN